MTDTTVPEDDQPYRDPDTLGETKRSAIHDLGYRRYLGNRRPQATRWRAVVKNMLKMTWKGWWGAKVWIFGAASVVFTLGFVMTIAVEKVSSLPPQVAGAAQAQMTAALNTGLAQAFQWLPWMAFVLSLTALGRTVARDLEAGAFEFYFSRPVRPIDYVGGKLGGAFILVGAQLLVGPLFLSMFRVGIDWDHVGSTWKVIPQSLLIGFVATTFFASVAAGNLGARRQTSKRVDCLGGALGGRCGHCPRGRFEHRNPMVLCVRSVRPHSRCHLRFLRHQRVRISDHSIAWLLARLPRQRTARWQFPFSLGGFDKSPVPALGVASVVGQACRPASEPRVDSHARSKPRSRGASRRASHRTRRLF